MGLENMQNIFMVQEKDLFKIHSFKKLLKLENLREHMKMDGWIDK